MIRRRRRAVSQPAYLINFLLRARMSRAPRTGTRRPREGL